MRRIASALIALTVAAAALAACGGGDASLTIYSGRSEDLVSPLIDRFEEETGIDVAVRYGDSGELAATLVEEGSNSPADLFLAQDPASLGRVALEGLFITLPSDTMGTVPARFSDSSGRWVGVSGRARVVVYDATKLEPGDLPDTEDGFTSDEWRGRVGIAPTNGSFLAFVAAKILLDGEGATRAWLEAMEANSAPTFPRNSVIVAAVDDGTVDAGLVNHYYLLRRIAEEGAANVVAANHFLDGGGAASLVMPSGIGILASSSEQEAAIEFVEFLLSEPSQAYFAGETFEYPLLAGVAPDPALPPLESLRPPDLDLSRLAEALDLATDLVAEAGLL
jgi:iron(III) transport system substrate-binding protein